MNSSCSDNLKNKKIILGISGSIAAYKSAYIASGLVKRGADVHVVMTKNATNLISPATFWSLTSNEVLVEMFEAPKSFEINHISLPESADLILIAPATANIIGKIANGIADDMLSTMALSTNCPIVFAPAMNVKMYLNSIVKENIEKLRLRGFSIVEPENGRLACGTEGIGRLAEPDDIILFVESLLNNKKKDYNGLKIVVTAGPTQEAIDPVRFISNRSSGKMGYAIAQKAVERGAEVTLISGPTSIKCPDDLKIIYIQTVEQMYNAVKSSISDADIFISAAAPADFTPEKYSKQKIHKSDEMNIRLLKTTDIIKEISAEKSRLFIVGFAAETQNHIESAKTKIETKNLDMIIVNDVSEDSGTFGGDYNKVSVINKNKDVIDLDRMSKIETADKILDYVIKYKEEQS